VIRNLQHIGLTVPDLEVGRAFYELFGLEARADGDDLVFRCVGRAQDQVRLIPGAKKRLAYVSYGTNAEGMDVLLERLQRAGVPLADAPYRVPFGGIWFQDPHGDWINVQVASEAPVRTVATPEINTSGRYRRIGTRACDFATPGKRAVPLRLGHLIKFTPDVDASVDFYTNVLGLKVSDRAVDILAFLRGSAGGDHHLIGLAKSSHTGLHHMSFEVADIDEIEMGAQALLRAGYRDGFGFGRHLGGSNYFHYIRDPWGSLVEYFWDIDVIPEDDSEWVALNGMEHLGMVWSTTPAPPDFIQNFEPAD
jgi:catechol 2,3-dioxygenase-like lactoylglutathione lyase family enzyme